MTLKLQTFGAVYLERDNVPLAGVHTQRRRLALLAYLAASERAVITRQKLIAMLSGPSATRPVDSTHCRSFSTPSVTTSALRCSGE